MMCKHPEKRDVFDYGLTVLELLLIAIMCLRMSGMGKCLFLSNALHWDSIFRVLCKATYTD